MKENIDHAENNSNQNRVDKQQSILKIKIFLHIVIVALMMYLVCAVLLPYNPADGMGKVFAITLSVFVFAFSSFRIKSLYEKHLVNNKRI